MPAPRVTKIFDPADGFGPFATLHEVTDSTIAHRDGRWWMCVAGQPSEHQTIELFSASLPVGAPLAATGWALTPDPVDPTTVALVGTSAAARGLHGGRHCPSYVRGVDPRRGTWVERIYYAGAAENPWGPYAIGFLEWDGQQWVDQETPVFTATEGWERGSVYEPNVVFADGVWRLWYVAGSNADNYLVHGVSESADGRTGWTKPRIFAPAEEHLFDFRAFEHEGRTEAVFSRVWLGGGAPPPETGLWWCHAPTPSPRRDDWSRPVQILGASPGGWYTGPWKPAPQYGEDGRLFAFFDGIYHSNAGGGFPFVFTLGCLEIDPPGR